MSETVQPKLAVRLKTDPAGNPRFVEGEKRRHYRIVFEIENAPEDVYLAQVDLDPSYHDPVRNLERGPDGAFRLETTTYGDYPIVVHLYRSNGYDVVLSDSVARALRRSSTPVAPAVEQAVDYISRH